MSPIVNETNLWLKQAFSLPVVVTLLLYTMGASTFVSAWKSDMEGRVKVLEKSTNTMALYESRIVILEQQAIAIRDSLTEIKIMLRDKKASLDVPLVPLETPSLKPASAPAQ